MNTGKDPRIAPPIVSKILENTCAAPFNHSPLCLPIPSTEINEFIAHHSVGTKTAP